MASLTEQQIDPIARRGIPAVAAIVVALSGCSYVPDTMVESAPQNSKIERVHDKFVGFDVSTGEVELKRIGRVRLAGIRMRPVSVTGEHDDAVFVRRAVTSVSADVLVVRDGDEPNVAVFYRHPVFIRDKYLPTWIFMPQDGWTTLNEFLLYTGMANYDRTTGTVSPTLAASLRSAEMEYAYAVYYGRANRRRDLVAKNPREMYFLEWKNRPLPEFRAVAAVRDADQKGSTVWWRAFFGGQTTAPSTQVAER